VDPLTQEVGPLYPIPPHWPHFVCCGPVPVEVRVVVVEVRLGVVVVLGVVDGVVVMRVLVVVMRVLVVEMRVVVRVVELVRAVVLTVPGPPQTSNVPGWKVEQSSPDLMLE
jgi:hypothetical protein